MVCGAVGIAEVSVKVYMGVVEVDESFENLRGDSVVVVPYPTVSPHGPIA